MALKLKRRPCNRAHDYTILGFHDPEVLIKQKAPLRHGVCAALNSAASSIPHDSAAANQRYL